MVALLELVGGGGGGALRASAPQGARCNDADSAQCSQVRAAQRHARREIRRHREREKLKTRPNFCAKQHSLVCVREWRAHTNRQSAGGRKRDRKRERLAGTKQLVLRARRQTHRLALHSASGTEQTATGAQAYSLRLAFRLTRSGVQPYAQACARWPSSVRWPGGEGASE